MVVQLCENYGCGSSEHEDCSILKRDVVGRGGSAAARLLGLWVRMQLGAWMSVSCQCCVLSGRGLCVGLIPRPEESLRVWCVRVWWWSVDSEEALAHQRAVRPMEKRTLTEWLDYVNECTSARLSTFLPEDRRIHFSEQRVMIGRL
jgi:hypothetical protein